MPNNKHRKRNHKTQSRGSKKGKQKTAPEVPAEPAPTPVASTSGEQKALKSNKSEAKPFKAKLVTKSSKKSVGAKATGCAGGSASSGAGAACGEACEPPEASGKATTHASLPKSRRRIREDVEEGLQKLRLHYSAKKNKF